MRTVVIAGAQWAWLCAASSVSRYGNVSEHDRPTGTRAPAGQSPGPASSSRSRRPKPSPAAAAELEAAGFALLHDSREEPWGQTVARLQSLEGTIIGISYAP